MDLDVMHYERHVYTIFDMLSDLGGLIGILTSVFAVFNAWWNYQAFENFMASRLFKVRKPAEDIRADMDYFDKSDYIKISNFPNFKNWILSLVPTCCKCFIIKRSKKENAMQMAREKLAKEINIIE